MYTVQCTQIYTLKQTIIYGDKIIGLKKIIQTLKFFPPPGKGRNQRPKRRGRKKGKETGREKGKEKRLDR